MGFHFVAFGSENGERLGGGRGGGLVERKKKGGRGGRDGGVGGAESEGLEWGELG